MAKRRNGNKKKRRNTLEELADKLNLSRSTIYQYAKERKIPCIKIGHRYVVPDDVEQRIKELAYRDWPPPEAKPPPSKEGQPVDEATAETTTPAAGSDTLPEAKKDDDPS